MLAKHLPNCNVCWEISSFTYCEEGYWEPLPCNHCYRSSFEPAHDCQAKCLVIMSVNITLSNIINNAMKSAHLPTVKRGDWNSSQHNLAVLTHHVNRVIDNIEGGTMLNKMVGHVVTVC